MKNLGELAQLGFNRDGKILIRLRPNHRNGVDQEAGRTLHPNLATEIALGLHQVFIFITGKAFGELVLVQIDLLGKFDQVLVSESALIFAALAFKKHIMVFPELILIGGAFTGFCGPVGFIAQKGEMDVTQADFPAVDIFFDDLTTRVSGKFATVGSLKVAEFDDRHRGAFVAQEMPRLTDDGV